MIPVMHVIEKINPEIPLRLAFGLMYIYSGLDLIRNPAHWYGFAPAWFERAVGIFLSMDSYLWLQGAGEIVIALLLLAWFLGRWGVRLASLLALIEMMGILFFAGIDPITFRDIGLVGGMLSLWILSLRSQV